MYSSILCHWPEFIISVTTWSVLSQSVSCQTRDSLSVWEYFLTLQSLCALQKFSLLGSSETVFGCLDMKSVGFLLPGSYSSFMMYSCRLSPHLVMRSDAFDLFQMLSTVDCNMMRLKTLLVRESSVMPLQLQYFPVSLLQFVDRICYVLHCYVSHVNVTT